MKIGELFNRVKNEYPEFVLMYQYINTNRFEDLEITGITDDSRKVKPGYIFVAIKGFKVDGHNHINEAIENGAVAVIYQAKSNIPREAGLTSMEKNKTSKTEIIDQKSFLIEVDDSRKALGLLWASWYDFPSNKMKVIGITGTDGKTTTANLLYHILKESGKKAGLISTINARIGEREIDTGFHVTNPEPELLQKLLFEMLNEGLEYVVLEVTSHGIDQERIAGVKLMIAIITNVSHEHLDYHKSYENYIDTKARLFNGVRFSVLNFNDASFKYLEGRASGEIISYALEAKADFMAKNIILKGGRSYWELEEATGGQIGVNLSLPGIYNVSNALAATAAARRLGLDLTKIKLALENFLGLTGRFEFIEAGQPFKVIVDFAHTPNALEQVLVISSKIKPACRRGRDQKSKLILVFGCAGERDAQKRPMMGEIAGRLADLTIITAEDPRRESLTDIIDYIAKGCLKGGAVEMLHTKNHIPKLNKANSFIKVPNRREAIELAVSEAKMGDVVLITGKGHERSMCFGTTEHSWSDQETARKALSKLGFGEK